MVGSIGLFGQPLFDRGASACVCVGSTTDAGVYVWAFEWWPHALLHGLNPFYTHLLYAPQGINLAHGSLVPGAALALAPITAIAGPLFSFNLAMVLSPALAAFFAFLLCRRVTQEFWPSLLGGWLFGFSSYMLGQLTGHLNLTLVFMVPAIAHLVLRASAWEVGRTRLVVLLTLALAAQLSFSLEVTASFTLFGAVAVVLAYILGEARTRERLRELFGPIALSYLIAGLLASPYLYYALKPGGLPVLPARTDIFSNDLLSFAVPTKITQVGGLTFASTSQKFTALFAEGGGYLGLPLLVIIGLAARRSWSRPGVRAMLASLFVVMLLSLGGHLHVAGSRSLPLPWGLVNHAGVLGLMLPARFILYADLIAAVLAATWLAGNRSRVGAWLLGALAVVSLWPAVGRHYWRSAQPTPTLFSSSAYRRVIGPRDTVLVIPVGIYGQSMLWQAQARLGFTMAGGYVVPPEAPDPYKADAIYPTLTRGRPVPNLQSAAAFFLRSHHVTVAAMDAAWGPNTQWARILNGLGWRATVAGGVRLLRPGH